MQTVDINPLRSATRCGAALLTSLLISRGGPEAKARPDRPSSIQVIPTITEIGFNTAGDLVASGTAIVQARGKSRVIPLDDTPVNLALAENQGGGGTSPILDLSIGPIDLNVLGLVVETREICLKLTALEDGGLLGDLLCGVADLLSPGIPSMWIST